MKLPPDFQFSQGSLQAFVDCPRLFELRYVERLAWPAPESAEPLERERLLVAGQAFHRKVLQHSVGVAPGALAPPPIDDELNRWWRNYQEAPPRDLPDRRYAETVLSAPVAKHRLIAKYDLVAVEPGRRAVIVDWKTSQSRPSRTSLAARLQTRVYAYLLVLAGHELNLGQPLAPDTVEMVYWFANFPTDLERFAYDPAQHEANAVYLVSLIETIRGLRDGQYPKTDREARCGYCRYAPLCDRGTGASQAGTETEDQDITDAIDLDLAIDFEQIAEIEY